MQPEEPGNGTKSEPEPGSPEWILQRLSRMEVDRLAGDFPEDRETILKRLGYQGYPEYLLSPLWRRIRRRVLKRDEQTCFLCDEKATQVHHLAYTERVLRGEDDGKLRSVCEECHKWIEFDAEGIRRTEAQKFHLLADRERATQERIADRQRLIAHKQRQKELRDQVCAVAGGRCSRCKGDTENHIWQNDGRVYKTTGRDGEATYHWLCSACSSELDQDKNGRQRTDEEKLKVLKKKPNVRYTRPAPATGYHFRKSFGLLNAMQREGIMNEFNWNGVCRDPQLQENDPERYEQLRARFESTKANGLPRRKSGPKATASGLE